MTYQEKWERVIKGLECCLDRLIKEERGIEERGVVMSTRQDSNNNIDAIRDALALLKAQEPCEDWISRKRLKDEIQYYIDEAGWGEEVNKALGWCLEFIDNQRAVTWNDA